MKKILAAVTLAVSLATFAYAAEPAKTPAAPGAPAAATAPAAAPAVPGAPAAGPSWPNSNPSKKWATDSGTLVGSAFQAA